VSLCLFLALITDSRISAALIIVFTLLTYIFRRVDLQLGYLSIPVVMSIAGGVYAISGDNLGDILFRLGITFEVIGRTSLPNIIFGAVSVDRAGDSGVLYLINAVGLVGAAIEIYFVCGLLTFRWSTDKYVPLLTGIYATSTALFGGALFSIKTAALLGVFMGALGSGLSPERRREEDNAL
jgi:putative polymerase